MKTSSLNDVLVRLSAGEVVGFEDWPPQAGDPEDFGILIGELGRLSFEAEPDFLDTSFLRRQFEGHQGFRLVHAHSTVSTNSDLMEFGRTSSIHNVVHIAEHQVGGRGRRSRMWLTPYLRGLAISVGYETTKSVFALQGLSLAVGVAVCTALRAAGAKECGLKWPNDVVFRNSKLAGILVEHQAGEKKSQFVIGVGINVELSADERARIDQPVVDLRELGVAGDRTTIGCAVIRSVFDHVHGFVEDGRRAYVRSFKELHLYHGHDCVVTLPNEVVTGRIVDIDDDGSLVLSVRGALRKFVSGDVSVRGVA